MVWGLFPVDPLPGEHKYYIFRKGVYKVGRKDCDIIINKDKGVSRVHAEIIVDEMICMDHSQNMQSNNLSKVQIRDCSKYGTFIIENVGSKQKVHEFPNKEAMLKDGDLVSFGTGNATYRFSFVPLRFCVSSSGMNQKEDKMSLTGASVTRTWTSHCTHLVIDDSLLLNNDVIDAIVARKPIVSFSWIELISGKTICTEIPSFLSHAPALIVEGESLKVADPQSREHCLKGYTFLLQSIHQYKFKESLQSLLEVCGAQVVAAQDQSDQSRYNLGDELVFVMPAGLSSCTESSINFHSLPKVKEMGLISAIISGHLDPSIMASSPVPVSSSCSTDETVVADSDVEMETATSVPKPTVNLIESAKDERERKREIHKIQSSENDSDSENKVHAAESIELDGGGNTGAYKTTAQETQEFPSLNRPTSDFVDHGQSAVKSDEIITGWSRDHDEGGIILRKDKDQSSKSENPDIIYSQDLIVRGSNLPQFGHGHSSSSGTAINFKRFRKRSVPSGNSFDSLIPFSKYPYQEVDYGNEDVAESVKEEKTRKQMEAIAEDLFNNKRLIVIKIYGFSLSVLTSTRYFPGEKAFQVWFSSWAFSSWLIERYTRGGNLQIWLHGLYNFVGTNCICKKHLAYTSCRRVYA